MNFVQPDIEFITQLKQESNAPLKQCMQCGTCSVVCKIAPEDNPFPRKEMMMAGWGMKDKLLCNPNLWLCHQCGECSSTCPRGVRPADVLSTLRKMTIKSYAKPRFLVEALSKSIWLPVLLIVPLILILGIIYIAGTLHIPEGPVNYSKFFPHAALNISFTALFFSSFATFFLSIRGYWKNMSSHYPLEHKNGKVIKRFLQVLPEILSHKKFNSCATKPTLLSAHFLVFWGFVLLLVVTLFAILSVVMGIYPMDITNPVKITGNLAALMLVVGLGSMILKRIRKADAVKKSSYFDWVFLISMFILTISGVLVEMARFLEWGTWAYVIYVFHLLFVWLIIIYLPYTKFAHIVYRLVTLVYSKRNI